MKASRISFAFPVLLFLGGCLEPIPFDHPGYPRNSSLRYPPGGNYSPDSRRPGYNPRNVPNQGIQNPNSPWGNPPFNQRDQGFETRQPEDLTPKPKPKPKPPEERELLRDIDPITESTKPKYPYAIPVQGAENLVVSPYAKDGPYLDTAGLSSGTQIECEVTGKTILVP